MQCTLSNKKLRNSFRTIVFTQLENIFACIHSMNTCKDVFNPNVTAFQSNCAEGLHFSAFHYVYNLIIYPHCALYKQLFNMAGHWPFKKRWFFGLASLGCITDTKWRKYVARLPPEFITAFLESSWNSHVHNFVPHNAIKLILYVLYSPNG